MKKTAYVLMIGIMLTLTIGLVSCVNPDRHQPEDDACQTLTEANFTGTRSIETIPTPVEVGSQLRGVIEDLGFDDLRRELKSTNGWIGEIGGLVYSLSAGFYREDESLGLVQLRIITTEEYSRTTVMSIAHGKAALCVLKT